MSIYHISPIKRKVTKVHNPLLEQCVLLWDIPFFVTAIGISLVLLNMFYLSSASEIPLLPLVERRLFRKTLFQFTLVPASWRVVADSSSSCTTPPLSYPPSAPYQPPMAPCHHMTGLGFLGPAFPLLPPSGLSDAQLDNISCIITAKNCGSNTSNQNLQ